MRQTILFMLASIWFVSITQATDLPRLLPVGELPEDARLGPLHDLNGYFPFQKASSPEAWEKRATQLRQQVLVALGQWPGPTRSPLNATVHSPVEREGYTVWRVYFESMPGHFVTGSLYRPKQKTGRLPAVLSPHGHFPGGRFNAYDEKKVRRQIAIGGERFLIGGRYPLQARCVQLARMGCVVFLYDMIGYADSVQLVRRAGVRESMNRASDWGLASPQAELHLQNHMGLQTWNSVRAMDFLTSLPDVDPKRIAVTGASGGGTQTFLLMAVDDRPAAAVPCVMVSTAMQGGCNCENTSYLRIGAGNIDLAALTAPRPMGLTAANDWTIELETKGYPDLVALYKMLGHEGGVRAVFHTHFLHNYNGVNRMFMASCINDFFDLGFETPILERDFVPLSQEEMTVWTADHPAPRGDQIGDSHERALLRWWTEDSRQQIEKLREDRAAYAEIVGGAWDVMIGRRLSDVGAVQRTAMRGIQVGEEEGQLMLLTDPERQEQIPTMVLYPSITWNRQVVLWLTDTGKSGLLTKEGAPREAVRDLLNQGYAVVGVDLLYQGEFLAEGDHLSKTRLNIYGYQPDKEPVPWQRHPSYTFGYNRTLFAQRVHDILTTVHALETDPRGVQEIHLVGQGKEAGALALVARAQAGEAITKTAAATDGFRFASVNQFDDPMFVPGAAKYEDIDGLKRLLGDAPLWLDEKPQPHQRETEMVLWLDE